MTCGWALVQRQRLAEAWAEQRAQGWARYHDAEVGLCFLTGVKIYDHADLLPQT